MKSEKVKPRSCIRPDPRELPETIEKGKPGRAVPRGPEKEEVVHITLTGKRDTPLKKSNNHIFADGEQYEEKKRVKSHNFIST